MTMLEQLLSRRYSLQGIELIIFDMDGLLLDTESISIKSWIKACKRYGYNLDFNLAIQRIGTSRNTRDDFYIKHMGPGFPIEEVDKLRNEYFEDIVYKNDTILKEGVMETLDYLDHLGLKKAVATSTFENRATKLLKLTNIYDRFDVILCGDEVTNPKPNPEIYNKVCSELGVDKKRVIVFEDSDIGALAAYNAGIKYILIPDLKPATEEALQNAYGVLESLLDFKKYFTMKTR
jgi:HAD superfamily hydrolase (TIGR01509 family)